jgi:hypothetical protein
MRFTQIRTKTVSIPVETPAEQLEQARQLRREAKAEFDRDWKALHQYLNANPPLRKPFTLNDRYFFVPVNCLASVRAEQRALENQVAHSKARWTVLMEQEADLLRRLGKI